LPSGWIGALLVSRARPSGSALSALAATHLARVRAKPGLITLLEQALQGQIDREDLQRLRSAQLGTTLCGTY